MDTRLKDNINTDVLSAIFEKNPRLPYSRPYLKTYGQLRELTDGGSGAITEAVAMNMGIMNKA